MRLAILAALVLAGHAEAQTSPPCAGRSQQIAHLAGEYGETPVFSGLGYGGEMFEVTVNPVTGSWTILSTTPEMKSCLRFGGQAGGLVAPKLGDPS